MRSILADVCECVPPEKLGRLHDRLIFVQYGGKTSVSDHTMDLGGHLLPMTCITTDDLMSVYEAILQSHRMYSPKVIRELRGSVFKLAERIDPTSEVVTSGFDAVLDHMEPGQRIAIQVATTPASIGMPIYREDIFQDVVLDDLHVDPRFIVEAYLTKYIRSTNNIMPVFKYIQDMGDDVPRPVMEYARGLTSLGSFRNASIRKTMAATHRRFAGRTTVVGLEEAAEPGKLFYFIPQLQDDEIDVDELEAVLRGAILVTGAGSPEREGLLKKNSNFRKCVRMYDFLRYGPK